MLQQPEVMPITPARTGEEGAISRKLVAGVTGLALATTVGVFGYRAAFGGNDSAHRSPVPATSPMSDRAIDCDTLQFTAVDAEASFDAEAALTRNNVNSKTDVQPYVDSLFGTKGPLGGNASAASLAGAESIVTISATDKNAAKDPHYSYVKHWKDKVSQYAAKGGLEVAKQDCADTQTVFGEVASYNDNWAHVGDKVTEFKFNRNGQYAIDGLKVVDELVTDSMVGTGSKGAQGSMSGVELTYSPTAHDVLSGFGDYLITKDGRIFAKGYRPEETGTLNEGSPTPSPSPVNGGKANNSNNNGSNGNGGGSNGGGVNVGNNPEHNPNGPNRGPGTGPSAEASPGNDNTPNGGGSSPSPTTPGGGNSPSPSEAPSPTPSPTHSPSPSPTPSPSHSPSPSSSPSPKGPEPSCTPNPPYVIC